MDPRLYIIAGSFLLVVIASAVFVVTLRRARHQDSLAPLAIQQHDPATLPPSEQAVDTDLQGLDVALSADALSSALLTPLRTGEWQPPDQPAPAERLPEVSLGERITEFVPEHVPATQVPSVEAYAPWEVDESQLSAETAVTQKLDLHELSDTPPLPKSPVVVSVPEVWAAADDDEFGAEIAALLPETPAAAEAPAVMSPEPSPSPSMEAEMPVVSAPTVTLPVFETAPTPLPAFEPSPELMPAFESAPEPMPAFEPAPPPLPVFEPAPAPLPVFEPAPAPLPVFEPAPVPTPAPQPTPASVTPPSPEPAPSVVSREPASSLPAVPPVAEAPAPLEPAASPAAAEPAPPEQAEEFWQDLLREQQGQRPMAPVPSVKPLIERPAAHVFPTPAPAPVPVPESAPTPIPPRPVVRVATLDGRVLNAIEPGPGAPPLPPPPASRRVDEAPELVLAAPVEMWFGDSRIGVKAGSATFDRFRKYADAMLDDLKEARAQSR